MRRIANIYVATCSTQDLRNEEIKRLKEERYKTGPHKTDREC